MNRKRLLEEDTNELDTKKAKVQIFNNKDNCINEEMEKELKLLDINYPIDLEEIKAKKFFHKASKYGCINVLRELLKHNLDVNDRNLNGFTALHLAAVNGHAIIVAELLVHKADIELQNGNGCTNTKCQVNTC